MMNLAYHATVRRSVLNFYNLRNLVQTKCEKSSLLILGSTYLTLYLLYFYCCHNVSPY